MIRFGSTGLGSTERAESTLSQLKEIGVDALEIPFTYQVYLDEYSAEKLATYAKKNKIFLSIHAPYYVNLNASTPEKRKQSMQRILQSCKIGHLLNGKKKTPIVFHPGYYGEDKELAFQNIQESIDILLEEIEHHGWNVELCPETMGKINVFGNIDEISKLVKLTGCSFCLDFAHILAREKTIDLKRIKKLFPQRKWHCHFSGINYGEKGEKNHELTQDIDWQNILKDLPKSKSITIICESPSPIEDTLRGKELYQKNY